MSNIVFYSPDHKIMPIVAEGVMEKLKVMKLNQSIQIDNLKYTVCDVSKIPDSRNKFGRMGNDIKCVLIENL